MADLRPSVVLVGESPPPGAPPTFRPFDCGSGQNLVRHLGLVSRAALLEHVPRGNIFDSPGVGIGDGPKWDDAQARVNAIDILDRQARAIGDWHGAEATVVALGTKPGAALGVGDLPWYAWRRDTATGVHVVSAPHPSGRASIIGRMPSGPVTFRRALLPELVVGCPTLRPWHFTTRVDPILADLGAALCPYDPAVGVIAAVLADEAFAMPAVMPDIHRATASLPMVECVRALADGSSKSRIVALGALYRCRRGSDLKARVAAAERSVAAGYPAEVLRATIGRYVALGIL